MKKYFLDIMIIDIMNKFYHQLRHIVLSKMIWIKNNSGKLQAMKKIESGLPTKSMHFRFRFQTNVIKTRYRLSINNVVEKSWSTMNFFLTHWSRANFTKNSIWQFQTWLNALLVLNAIYVTHTICSQYSYPLKSYY